MIDPVDVDSERTPITILTRVLPTVVVRRRVYEVAKASIAATSSVASAVALPDDDDEEPPPSSVDVARALASLHGKDLRRLEAIVSAAEAAECQRSVDEADAAAEARSEEARANIARDAERSASPVKTIAVGSTITVPELARRIGVESSDLVATLVAGGFFDITAKSTLTHDLARAAAWMFGFAVEDGPEDPAPRAKAGSKSKSSGARRVAKSSGVKAAVGAKKKVGSKSKPKPAAKKSNRRG